jgi:hypothetical membrane protein
VIGPQVSAWVFGVLTAVLALFQLALALGAPWGHLAMGGRYPGRFPPPMRIAALAQVAINLALAAIVFARAGVALPELFDISRIGIWIVVAVMALAVVLNLITPSRWERRLWAPVAIPLLASSVHVALS